MPLPIPMAETARTAFLRGLGVHVGLGIGLLITVIFLGLAVQSVAADVGIPQSLTDPHVLALTTSAVFAAVAVGASLWTGIHYGNRNPGETGTAVGHALLVTVVGLAILILATFGGLRAGIAMVAAEEDPGTVGLETLARLFFLVVPGIVIAIVAAVATSRLPTTAPTEAPEARAPEPEPEPAGPAGGGTPIDPEPTPEPTADGSDPGPAQTQAPAGTVETKRLKCPSCTSVFETSIEPGSGITCPECGYRGSSTT